MTIHAIYENGLIRPLTPLGLPDPCEVEVEVRSLKPDSQQPTLQDVYFILKKRFDSGEHDVAARQDEHQP
jgi:predicted DNA-binding antitoxin AbrB/MazE fold protein